MRRLSRIITRFRGNPKALATSLVFVVVTGAAIALMIYKPTGFDITSGALMGAGVSTLVASLIEFLQDPDDRKIPYQFVEAAKREVHLIGYYRENQEVHIDFVELKDQKQGIKISLNSKLIPIRDEESFLDYPRISPPSMFKQIRTVYKVGGEIVSPGTQRSLTGPADESLEVEYEILDNSKVELSDEHVWLSPVLAYDVYFKIPSHFFGEVYERISDKYLSIRRSGRQGSGQIHCSQPHSAFSRQGFTWKILKGT
jgi:hypothetical protein